MTGLDAWLQQDAPVELYRLVSGELYGVMPLVE
jgi:hypothetical protein